MLNLPILLIVLWLYAYLWSQEIYTEVFRAKGASYLQLTLIQFREKIYLERENNEANVANVNNQPVWRKSIWESFVLLL